MNTKIRQWKYLQPSNEIQGSIFLCATGFQEGEIKWDDEDTKNDNMAEGILPDGEYKKDTTLQFCCRSDGSAENPIELPIREPFFLLKHSGRCQVVLGMRVTEEWLFWDCEDRENKNSYNGEVPASFITKDVKLHYCYYEKQWKKGICCSLGMKSSS